MSSQDQRISIGRILLVQLVVLFAFVGAYAAMSTDSHDKLRRTLTQEKTFSVVKIDRQRPLEIQPIDVDSDIVSAADLAAVLRKVRPRFKVLIEKTGEYRLRSSLSPNHVEHALRTWRVEAEFDDPAVMTGSELVDFLTNHGKYLTSWNRETRPLLIERPAGVAIRWGRTAGGSVHHDHWLACLTEAGIPLDHAVFTPTRRDMTINDVVQEALRDLRLDERETEWSSMSFGLWLSPTKTWKSYDGRQMSFDLLATRLLRGDKRFGVCSGTHRVYSLMSLIRLDDDFDILSDPIRDSVYSHLERVRDLIVASQFQDGHWPSNWSQGAEAVKNPIDDPEHKQVIATGHHLEWLAIAPKDLYPPPEQIKKAADWIVAKTKSKSDSQILGHYTFYSHVGNALALWRSTRPPDFWNEWRKTHVVDGVSEPDLPADKADH